MSKNLMKKKGDVPDGNEDLFHLEENHNRMKI